MKRAALLAVLLDANRWVRVGCFLTHAQLDRNEWNAIFWHGYHSISTCLSCSFHNKIDLQFYHKELCWADLLHMEWLWEGMILNSTLAQVRSQAFSHKVFCKTHLLYLHLRCYPFTGNRKQAFQPKQKCCRISQTKVWIPRCTVPSSVAEKSTWHPPRRSCSVWKHTSRRKMNDLWHSSQSHSIRLMGRSAKRKSTWWKDCVTVTQGLPEKFFLSCLEELRN